MRQQFEDVFGYTHHTTSKLASGGQGTIFRTKDTNIVIKVEHDSSGIGFLEDTGMNRIFDEIRLLPISRKLNITLPQATLKDYSGYVMTLLDDMESFEKAFDYSFDKKSNYTNEWLEEYRETAAEFVEVMAQYMESGGRRRRLEAYLRVASMLSELHASGLVYCDFSSKNAFVSSVEGNDTVWLIDADNLNYQACTRKAGLFTPGYGAPELFKGRGCTFYSDSYAFAVSLFWQLTGTHPFMGESLTTEFDDDFADEKEERAFMGEYPWIMDAEDTTNHSDTQIHMEFVVGKSLDSLFQRTFCKKGKEIRHSRPTMFEWTRAIAKEKDQLIRCKHCGMDYDASFDVCPWCDQQQPRFRLVSGDGMRMVWSYYHELEDNVTFSVPLRLIRGFRNGEVEDIAFLVTSRDGSLSLSDLNEMSEWSVSIDKGVSFSDIYGKVTIPDECLIRSVERKNGNTVIIEVNRV